MNILDYADASAVSAYAVSAMQWARGAGVLNGQQQASGVKLDPKGSTTRAQLATMLMRLHDIW